MTLNDIVKYVSIVVFFSTFVFFGCLDDFELSAQCLSFLLISMALFILSLVGIIKTLDNEKKEKERIESIRSRCIIRQRYQ